MRKGPKIEIEDETSFVLFLHARDQRSLKTKYVSSHKAKYGPKCRGDLSAFYQIASKVVLDAMRSMVVESVYKIEPNRLIGRRNNLLLLVIENKIAWHTVGGENSRDSRKVDSEASHVLNPV